MNIGHSDIFSTEIVSTRATYDRGDRGPNVISLVDVQIWVNWTLQRKLEAITQSELQDPV